jgi:hypothetical protein
MTVEAASLLLLAVVLVAWPGAGERAARRARRLRRDVGAGRAPDPPAIADLPAPAAWARRRRLLAGATGTAVAVSVGGVAGLVAAGVATVVALWWLRRAPDTGGAQLLQDLPAACDLLAVCLAAGTPAGSALAAVGAAVPPPLGEHLRTVAAHYRLGADPRRAWADVPPGLVPVGRLFVRSGNSGAAMVGALERLAGDTRAAVRATAEADVRKAGVWLLAPLGLCFLPAFLCLGVVPLVLGIAGEVFR